MRVEIERVDMIKTVSIMPELGTQEGTASIRYREMTVRCMYILVSCNKLNKPAST